MRCVLRLSLLPCLALLAPAQQTFQQTDQVRLFERRSELLSTFHGRDVVVQAGVVMPAGRKASEKLPVCFSIHGFGGSHMSASSRGPDLVAAMREKAYPQMLYVFLNAACATGHHEFADSENNGPWGRALVEEFVPALEAEFGGVAEPRGRFLTGHSSGGWSSLWLQITYPDVFGGTWSTAPDPVDFRDFTGVDIYRFENAYRDPDGKPIQLVRRGGEWVMTIEQFVQREVQRGTQGGQFASFEAVFSPRAKGGQPTALFDRQTGKIDATVAKAWEKYDIRLVLKRNWTKLGPKLQGKLKVYVGLQDSFRLEGACRLLRDELKELGSDAEFVFAEGLDHGSLLRPHAELWPEGLLAKIHKEMRARFDAKPAAR